MIIINKRHVIKARQRWECDWCDSYIKRGSPYTYYFAYAETPKRPSVLRCCPECEQKAGKIDKALGAGK